MLLGVLGVAKLRLQETFVMSIRDALLEASGASFDALLRTEVPTARDLSCATNVERRKTCAINQANQLGRFISMATSAIEDAWSSDEDVGRLVSAVEKAFLAALGIENEHYLAFILIEGLERAVQTHRRGDLLSRGGGGSDPKSGQKRRKMRAVGEASFSEDSPSARAEAVLAYFAYFAPLKVARLQKHRPQLESCAEKWDWVGRPRGGVARNGRRGAGGKWEELAELLRDAGLGGRRDAKSLERMWMKWKAKIG